MEKKLSKLELNIINYLENESNGAFLIDGPWGSGKTYTINKIVSKKFYEFKKIKYYSILDIEKIDSNFISNLILIIEEKNDSNSIEIKEAINNIFNNRKNNIIEFIDYQEFKDAKIEKFIIFFKDEDILKDLEYMSYWEKLNK